MFLKGFFKPKWQVITGTYRLSRVQVQEQYYQSLSCITESFLMSTFPGYRE